LDLDLRNAESVREALLAGARANREAKCREGSIDRIEAPGTLIATGDLHDNPLHLSRLVAAAGMMEGSETAKQRNSDTGGSGPSPVSLSRCLASPCHLVLHEIIHSDRLMNGMDFSYRALARVAALKAAFPERVHAILANHELSQVTGAGIVKDGVKVVEAFNEAVEYAFGGDASAVQEGVREFIYSMPLALRCVSGGAGFQPASGLKARSTEFLVAHSLPSPWLMARFDTTVLSRELTEADYEPRQGAAHIMVWGRGYDAEQIEDLVERWGVGMFILGHEKVDNGAMFVPPCVVVLNSDHERGVYLPIDLSDPPRAEEAVARVVPLEPEAWGTPNTFRDEPGTQ
jgi:hypothetical protein